MNILTKERERLFWSKVAKGRGCWDWIGSKSDHGYGRFSINPGNHRTMAHRLAYALIVGPISPGLTIDHLCRNKGCVNPSHLQAVCNRTNVLRGVGRSAVNARKRECVRGHSYTPENTLMNKDGSRWCKACLSDKNRRQYQKHRTKILAAVSRRHYERMKP